MSSTTPVACWQRRRDGAEEHIMSTLSVDTILRTALAASDGGRKYVPASRHRISTPFVVRTILEDKPMLLSPNISEEYRRIEIAAEEVDHNLVDSIIRFIISLNGRGEYISRLREIVRLDEPTVEDIGLVASAVQVWARSHLDVGDTKATA